MPAGAERPPTSRRRGHVDPPRPSNLTPMHGRAFAWAQFVIAVAILTAHGSFWTRGVLGDDLCMCELATARGFWDAAWFWLQNWNSRVFLALAQVGSYHLPWFAKPLEAPWFVLHGAILLAHMVTCSLLLNILNRAGIAAGPSLAAVLVLAIHPVTAESVLWLAAAYGYVLGLLLTVLAIWMYLEYARTGRRRWLLGTIIVSIAATLGIEQFLPILGALCCVNLLWSRRHGTGVSPWVAVAIVAGCALVFAWVHFGLVAGTSGRLAHAASKIDPVTRPSAVWHMAWWLSLLPEHSPWAVEFRIGLDTLRKFIWLGPLIAAVALVAAWRVLTAGSWADGVEPSHGRASLRLWLIVAGIAASVAALMPFAFSGYIRIAQRNAYVILPGLLVASAAMIDAMAARLRSTLPLRLTLVPLIAAGVTMSLIIGAGAQVGYAQNWRANREVIAIVESHADEIRATGGLELILESQSQARAALPVHPWMFPCLVRWVVDDGNVRSWIGSAPPREGVHTPPGSHRVYIRVP